jgi:hypothetical protein
LPLRHDQLLAQEHVPQDQFWLAACQARRYIQDKGMATGLCQLAKTPLDNLKTVMYVVTREGREWEVHCLPFELDIQAMILPQDKVT